MKHVTLREVIASAIGLPFPLLSALELSTLSVHVRAGADLCRASPEEFKRDHVPKRISRMDSGQLSLHKMPPVPVVGSLCGEIIRTVAMCPTARFYDLDHAAIRLLTHANPRILIIGEIQHLHSYSAPDNSAALNVIKYLTKNRRISVVAAGTLETFHVMRFDPRRPTILRVCPSAR